MDYSYTTTYSGGGDAASAAAAGGMLAVLMGFLLVMAIIGLAVYIYYAICLMKIAKKTNTANGWFAWIPILNVVLMIKIAKKPMWWIALFIGLFILCVIPILGFLAAIASMVLMIILWMKIAEAVGKPGWWGILMIVPIANLIIPGILAFSKSEGQAPVAA